MCIFKNGLFLICIFNELFIPIYLFIWLGWVLAAAHGIFVAACWVFSCGMRTLTCGMWDLVP